MLEFPSVTDHLARLTARVRWQRWLGRLTRLAWLGGAAFLLVYLADLTFGLDTWTLRIVHAALLVGVAVRLVFDFARSWWCRIDPLGVAQLLERTSPHLAERLVTLVQIQRDPTLVPDPELAYFLGLETEKQLAEIAPASACPLARPLRCAVAAVGFFAIVFGALSYVPTFALFAERFANAWLTSVVPYALVLDHSQIADGPLIRVPGVGAPIEMHALFEDACFINVSWRRLNKYAQEPAECTLVCQGETGPQVTAAMKPAGNGSFFHVIRNPARPQQCWAQCGEITSNPFTLSPLVRPAFKEAPSVVVTAPKYLGQAEPIKDAFGSAGDTPICVPRYSRLKLAFSFDSLILEGWLRVKEQAAPARVAGAESVVPIEFAAEDNAAFASIVAVTPGRFAADLIVRIDHKLCVILPVGQWTVHDDEPPRFIEPLRVRGSSARLTADKEQRIAPGEAVKLGTTVEDDQGLDAIAIEYRINDGPAKQVPWQSAKGKKHLAIDAWLPLPARLKDGDHVQFRVQASDNRLLKRGEIARDKDIVIPSEDLLPQVTTLPAAVGGEARWISFRVGKPGDSLVKNQVQAQADEVRAAVAQLQAKLRSEEQQLEKLRRDVHLQFALTPRQRTQTEKIRTLNREIAADLLRAGERFAANADLARLADLFFDIAETEMLKSAEALNRFRDKDRPLMEGEKDLQSAHNAVQQAIKKLERTNDLNKLLAQDRLDQWQIEKLAHRQDELAQKLDNLLKNQPLSDAELAQQIEAIREEQARLAAERAELESQSPLVKESRDALEQQETQRLVQAAEQLAAKMKPMRDADPKLAPGKAGKDLADKADKLANDLLELAQKGSGPEAKAMAKEAAQAIEQAKKAMAGAAAMKAKGDADAAKKAEDDAGKQLEFAIKKFAKLAQDQAMKAPAKDGAEKTAQALKDSGKLMKSAQDKLRAMPKDAQIAMKGAAQKLAQAAMQAQKQAAKHLPNVARNPTARASLPLGGASARMTIGKATLESFQGKSWGELPGELKTRMLQDVRTRFGEEYADLIQQYFERLAESPRKRD